MDISLLSLDIGLLYALVNSRVIIGCYVTTTVTSDLIHVHMNS